MSIDINQAVRLKSLIFWSEWMSRLPNEPMPMIKRFWVRRDPKAFVEAFNNDCPFCHGSPTFDPNNHGEPYYVRDVLIDRVQCYCMTIDYLSRKESRWYESAYQDRYLADIKPVDVPPGAAKQTEKVTGWLWKFFDHPARSALIYGKPGCGKTHMMHAIKTYFGRFAVYLTLADFRNKLMAYTVDSAEASVTEFVDKLLWAPILLLDDFGMEKQTDYSMDTLASIINSRYERWRYAPTIMTTNMPLTDMDARLKGGSTGNIERILSRMMDTGTSRMLWVNQDDYRLAPTKKAAGVKVMEDF